MERGKWHTHLALGRARRGGSGELQAYQPKGNLWVSYEVNSQETISKHVNGKVIWNSLHGFTKGKACLTNANAFCDEMMGSTYEGRAVCAVCLDFSKVFDVARLERYGLNRQEQKLVLGSTMSN